MVVHGEPGMDELSPLGATRILELDGSTIRDWNFDPRRELGWPAYEARDLAGGDQAENAAIVTGVLQGKVRGAARAAVILNAAAALYVGGAADSLIGGVQRAENALDAGAGWECLEALRDASRRAAGG